MDEREKGKEKNDKKGKGSESQEERQEGRMCLRILSREYTHTSMRNVRTQNGHAAAVTVQGGYKAGTG